MINNFVVIVFAHIRSCVHTMESALSKSNVLGRFWKILTVLGPLSDGALTLMECTFTPWKM